MKYKLRPFAITSDPKEAAYLLYHGCGVMIVNCSEEEIEKAKRDYATQVKI